MAAFWLGSVPVLALLGISVQTFASTIGRQVPLIISLIIVLLGLYTLGGRLTIPATAFEPPASLDMSTDAQHQVETIGETTPPCCCEENE